jgi:transaldolase
MQLFIDSSDPREITTAREWGIIDGVTTNPALISKGGPDMQETLRKILAASGSLPVLCQVIGRDDVASLMGQARWLHAFSERIIVKIPMSNAGIQAVMRLKKETPDMKVTVTLVSSMAQAYLAGKAGADIVALFNGPLDLALDQEVQLVAPVRQIFDNYGFTTKILSCGRFPRAFGDYAVEGTDICTMKLEYLSLLYEHPFTDKRFQGFMADWDRAFGKVTWPRKDA